MSSKWEIADVLRTLDLSSQNFTIHQEKTLRALSLCRTAALGGHVDACEDCGSLHISYNSCRNRHCPKCQGHKREEWINAREQDLLPCSYYHLVFTLPNQLNDLAIKDPRKVYKILFDAAWSTMSTFAQTEGLQLGMIAILHTWGQNLSLHPHLHCIVPGGGIQSNKKWKRKIKSDKYLFSVKALSKVFRAKYVAFLRKEKLGDIQLFDSLFQSNWVVYAKRPFGGPKQVIEYLGRYTHKVAISNHRLKNVTATQVTFQYKDYRNNGQNKQMVLPNHEFIRRFSLHILPKRFVRIRHYGILSSSWKRGKLQDLQKQLKVKRKESKIKTKHRLCYCCKEGNLVTLALFGDRGPPKTYLFKSEVNSPVN